MHWGHGTPRAWVGPAHLWECSSCLLCRRLCCSGLLCCSVCCLCAGSSRLAWRCALLRLACIQALHQVSLFAVCGQPQLLQLLLELLQCASTSERLGRHSRDQLPSRLRAIPPQCWNTSSSLPLKVACGCCHYMQPTLELSWPQQSSTFMSEHVNHLNLQLCDFRLRPSYHAASSRLCSAQRTAGSYKTLLLPDQPLVPPHSLSWLKTTGRMAVPAIWSNIVR